MALFRGLGLQELLLVRVLGSIAGFGPFLCGNNVVADVNVIKVDATAHSPDFDGDATNGGHKRVERFWVGFLGKVLRVGDLFRLPFSNVVRVVDHGVFPLTLVVRIGYHWTLPFATTRGGCACGILDLRGLPLAVLLFVPIFRHLRGGVGHKLRRVHKPPFGHLRVHVQNFFGGIFVPVVRFGRFRVFNLGLVDPVIGLRVGRIVDLFRGHKIVILHGPVYEGVHFLRDLSVCDRFAVDIDFKRLVAAKHGRVQVGVRVRFNGDFLFQMFFLPFL